MAMIKGRDSNKSYITPLASDVLFFEVVDDKAPKEQDFKYGDPHENSHRWPHHELVFVSPSRDGAQNLKWYAAKRENQDLYNFEFSRSSLGGSGGDRFHTVIRTYVEKRSEFDVNQTQNGQVMPNVPSDLFQGEYVLFSHDLVSIDDERLASLFVVERKTYAKRTTITQLDVAHDNGKSTIVRTDLYFATEKIDDSRTMEQVAADPEDAFWKPDNGTQKVFEQLSSEWYAVTTTSHIYSEHTKLGEPQIVGMPRSYVTEREVDIGTPLPVRGEILGSQLPSFSSHIVVNAEQAPRSGKMIQIIEHSIPPSWEELYGSERDRDLGVSIPYTQQVVPTPTPEEVAANPLVEYRVINEAFSLKRTSIIPTDALDSFYRSYPSRINLNLPPVLQSISVIWSEDSAGQNSDSDWSGTSVGTTSYNLSGSESASSSGSAVVIPELDIRILEIAGNGLPTTSHFLFLPMPVTTESILAALKEKMGIPDPGVVNLWPVFKTRSISMVLRGAKVGVQASASANAAQSGSPTQYNSEKSIGEGSGFDLSPTVNVTTIPPTLHGAITVSDSAARSKTISVSASVEWSGFNFPTVDKTVTASKTVTGSVSPTTIPATTPPGIPTSGIYLIDSRIDLYDYNYVRVFAETIDASIFA